MGGIGIVEYGEGAEPERAYGGLVEMAAVEYGRDPYSGTIATTEGFFRARSEPLPLDAAKHLANTEMWQGTDFDERVEKWGRCAAIPVADDAAFAWDTRFVKVTEKGEPGVKDLWSPDRVGAAAAVDEARPDGWVTARFEEVPSDRQRSKSKRSVTERERGKRRTAYFVVPVSDRYLGRIDEYGVFRTEADARKHLESAVEEHGVEMAVVGRRVTDAPNGNLTDHLVTCRPGEVSVVSTFKVDYCRAKVSDPPIIGWVFMGIAAC